MPTVTFSDEELEQVRNACDDYAFLGSKEVDGWTEEDEDRLCFSILEKLGMKRNDSKYLSRHTDRCRCKGCRDVRDEII